MESWLHRDRLTLRVSTVFVGLAAVSLVAGVLLLRLAGSSANDTFGTIGIVLYFGVFQLASLTAAVAAAVFLLKTRSWQFAVELTVSVAFLILLGLVR